MITNLQQPLNEQNKFIRPFELRVVHSRIDLTIIDREDNKIKLFLLNQDLTRQVFEIFKSDLTAIFRWEIELFTEKIRKTHLSRLGWRLHEDKKFSVEDLEDIKNYWKNKEYWKVDEIC